MTEPTEPHLIGGRYEINGLLGRGGMAEVRKGRDIRLGRVVAIKRLRSDLASDPTFQARFRREAQSAAALNHPTIVSVYDTGEETIGDQSVPYIVMEYVEGQTLRDLIRSGETLLPERSLEIVAGVLRALAYSHHAGIVHRDIKPANVMLTPAGEIKVMDFGIARAVADTSATMTQTAAVIGTAQYLSPEQARGSQVDARSDLYSTGCLLYELLTGRPPFVGESPVSVAYQHVREQPQPPSTIHPGLSPTIDAVVMRALEKNPDDRYQSAEDMRADVERAMRGERVSAAPTQVAPAVTSMMPTVAPAPVAAQVGYARPAASTVVREEYVDPEPPRGGKGTAWAIGILSLVLLAALGFIVVRVLGDGGGAEQVDVPRIVGLNEEAAAAELAGFGLELTRPCTQEANGDVEVGLIVSQDPSESATADEGSAVTCVVSSGADVRAVPPLVGLSQEDAEAAIAQAGLELGQVDRQNGLEPAGRVLSSTPGVGEQVPPSTEVALVVATGQNEVPNVVDPPLSQADAETAIRAAGLQPEATTEENADVEPGTVLRQNPPGGNIVDLNSTISIVVATAPPEPDPVPVPDVSGRELTFAQAAAELNAAGFVDVSVAGSSANACEVDPVPDDCVVVAQDPEGGTEVDDPAATPVELELEQVNGDERVAGVGGLGTLGGAVAGSVAGAGGAGPAGADGAGGAGGADGRTGAVCLVVRSRNF